MRTFEELIAGESYWPTICKQMRGAKNARILAKSDRGPSELQALQVTTKSPLGAIALETAGIFIDDGWLRVLGSGSDTVGPSLARWNGFAPESEAILPGALIVAYDVIGGIFAVNDTALPIPQRHIAYLAPDDLSWLDMEMGHGDFIAWACTKLAQRFYEDSRWQNSCTYRCSIGERSASKEHRTRDNRETT